MRFFKKRTGVGQTKNHESPLVNRGAGVSRRTFLTNISVGALLLSVAGVAYSFLRSLVPNVLYEAPRRFKIGRVDHFPEGVSYLDEKRLYVFKEGRTFHVISAICTHLGCTAKYVHFDKPKRVSVSGEQKEFNYEFQCPCHGSRFYGDGTNYAGPAPRPLPWYRVEVSPDDGQLVVNTSNEVDQNTRLTV